ncbi:MAG TPA: FAD-dependent oxidoreductase [Verrucomicrobiae bacterium]|nr:FAD-dependent oxidoreductase [Verrucomicrobiae bacterium]
MKLTGGDPFWSVRNGLLATYPPLDGDLTCDVAVVGGGITGALVAFHLVQAGVSAVLLDKRDIGTGSTCGSTGLLQYEVDVPLRQLVKQIGFRRAGRSYLLCLDALRKICALVHKFDLRCELRTHPSLFLARHETEIADLREEHQLRKRLGIKVDFWDRQQIEKHYPFSRPAALFSEDGAEVDPHRFTQGLLSVAVEKGLRIFDRTQVTKFSPTRQGMELTTETGHTVKARRVVIAAGFESQKYLSKSFGQLKSTYALISEPVPNLRDWYRRSLIWETGSPYLYLRTTGENRIIVGGEDVEIVNPAQRDRLIPAKTRILQRKFKELFPEIKLEVAFSWAGTFSSTKDGLAYIGGHRSLPHAYFAMGYGGNGITYSLIAAEIIRDHFLGRRNPDAALFSFSR